MNTVSIIERYKNRTIPFRFDGTELKFSLSLALFSSYDIDAGTKLLLKTLAQRFPLGKMRNFLDIGCGAGIIGIAAAKRHPHLRVTMQDRDVLAAEFAAHNAALNGIQDYHVSADLAFLRLPEQRYNAIVSNIPAKAGEPVLAHMAANMLSHLSRSEESIAAVVVIESLRKKFGNMIRESGGKIVHRESTKSHTVYHFVRTEKAEVKARREAGELPSEAVGEYDHEAAYSLPKVYFRTRVSPKLSTIRYSLDTVWGLPNFDNPSYRTQLFSQWAVKSSAARKMIIWNPGQGHIPVFAHTLWNNALESIELVGRDSLALAVTSHNLLFSVETTSRTVPDLTEAERGIGENGKSHDTCVICYDHSPLVEREQYLWNFAARALHSEGRLVIIGKSSDLHPFSKGREGFSLSYSQKHRGNRLLAFHKEG